MATNGMLNDANSQLELSHKIRARQFVSSTPGLALIYFCAIILAESTTVLIDPRMGMILHGCVLVVLLLHSALLARGIQQDFLLSLTLAPLVRLLSLSLPLAKLQFSYWYAIIGVPLMIAVIITARVIGLSRAQIGLTLKGLPVQFLIGFTGIGLGFIEYIILHPAPFIKSLSINEIWLPALILLIFTGLLEEVIFRGVMLYVSLRSLGRLGLFYVASIFAILHLGYKSIIDIVFVLAVGLLFGIIAHRTSSIIGVTLAHGFTNISLFLIFPFVISPTMFNISSIFTKPNIPISSSASTSPQQIITLTPTPFSSNSSTSSPFTQPSILIFPSGYAAVVDDGDPEFIRSGGVEYPSQSGFGGDFVWAFTTEDDATVQVEWRPVLSICGIYEVEIFLPSGLSLTNSAFYQIGYRQGMVSRTINQSALLNSWVSLGKYEFLSTSGSFLRLTNHTDEPTRPDLAIVFDAARWKLTSICKINRP